MRLVEAWTTYWLLVVPETAKLNWPARDATMDVNFAAPAGEVDVEPTMPEISGDNELILLDLS